MNTLWLATSLWLIVAAGGQSQERAPAGLRIEILDLVSSEGEVVIALFDSPEAYDQRSPALRSAVLPVVDSQARQWHLEGLVPGEYAVAAYQDLNGNRTLDKGRFGIPEEPYGFSRDAVGAFGPPPFEKTRFSYDGHGGIVQIRLRRR